MHRHSTSLDLSIAAELHLLNVHLNEQVVVTFTADEDWQGDFEFTVFNSPAKNSSTALSGAVVKQDKELRLTLDATAQSLAVGTHYYEIYNTLTKRVEFKGKLEIKK